LDSCASDGGIAPVSGGVIDQLRLLCREVTAPGRRLSASIRTIEQHAEKHDADQL
jgi:hypothetical protein